MSRSQAHRPCEAPCACASCPLRRQSLRLCCDRYTIRITMRFEWNEDKSRSNRKKHGVAFEAAVKVFNDPFLLLIKDRIEEGEQRWHAIGAAEAAILLVGSEEH